MSSVPSALAALEAGLRAAAARVPLDTLAPGRWNLVAAPPAVSVLVDVARDRERLVLRAVVETDLIGLLPCFGARELGLLALVVRGEGDGDATTFARRCGMRTPSGSDLAAIRDGLRLLSCELAETRTLAPGVSGAWPRRTVRPLLDGAIGAPGLVPDPILGPHLAPLGQLDPVELRRATYSEAGLRLAAFALLATHRPLVDGELIVAVRADTLDETLGIATPRPDRRRAARLRAVAELRSLAPTLGDSLLDGDTYLLRLATPGGVGRASMATEGSLGGTG